MMDQGASNGLTAGAAALLLLGLTWTAPVRAEAGAAMAVVAPSRLKLESGRVEAVVGEAFSVRDAVVRALAVGTRGDAARIDFTYLGPSRGEAPLASGELRRQIGLKLQARDGCNLVYVMWRLAPDQGIRVQLKSNPGDSSHRQCRDGGYQPGTPDWTRPVPPVQVGERRSLEARLDGLALRVLADGALAWEGLLPDAAGSLGGPAGFRSDNGAFEVVFRAASLEERSTR